MLSTRPDYRLTMRFDLVDRVLEASTESATTLKAVSMAEEYLQDHFPGFPVLPGVLMLEAMAQAGRVVARERGEIEPLTIGQVKGLKYNTFVPPGGSLRVRVDVTGVEDDGALSFRGKAELIDTNNSTEPQVAATGRFTLRRVRVGSPDHGPVGSAAPGA